MRAPETHCSAVLLNRTGSQRTDTHSPSRTRTALLSEPHQILGRDLTSSLFLLGLRDCGGGGGIGGGIDTLHHSDLWDAPRASSRAECAARAPYRPAPVPAAVCARRPRRRRRRGWPWFDSRAHQQHDAPACTAANHLLNQALARGPVYYIHCTAVQRCTCSAAVHHAYSYRMVQSSPPLSRPRQGHDRAS